MFKWKLFRGHCWVWRANELSQQVKTWPSGPFIFLSSASWKACSLEIHSNHHWESRGPTLCPVHWTVLCNVEIVPIPIPDSQSRGSQAKKQDASVKHTLHWQLQSVNGTIFVIQANMLGFKFKFYKVCQP